MNTLRRQTEGHHTRAIVTTTSEPRLSRLFGLVYPRKIKSVRISAPLYVFAFVLINHVSSLGAALFISSAGDCLSSSSRLLSFLVLVTRVPTLSGNRKCSALSNSRPNVSDGTHMRSYLAFLHPLNHNTVAFA